MSMSEALAPQQMADAFINDIRRINGGKLNRDSYKWPTIDYDQVSTETCKEIRALIGDQPQYRGYSPVTPETPRHEKIRRKLGLVLTEREYLVKKRVDMAQTIPEDISKHLEPVHQFLRAARRTDAEQINFPDTPQHLLRHINAVRKALDAVEDMVIGCIDADVTEPDSEFDGDVTRVETAGQDFLKKE
ncbi:hypothetical protein DFH09DRAFT_1115987 [Mycena vulgaris]|nr:hypothetical protein DFH09DRAFT_1115987 [Mycena vulgaris]